MKFILASALVLGLLFTVSFLGRSSVLRRGARLLILLTGLAFMTLAAACFVFPFFTRAEGRFWPQLFSVIPGAIGLGVLSLWRGAADGESYGNMSPEQKRAYTHAQFERGRADIEASLAKKRERLGRSFLMDPIRKSRLKQSIRQDEALLDGLQAMETSYGRSQDQGGRVGGPGPLVRKLNELLIPRREAMTRDDMAESCSQKDGNHPDNR